MNFRMSKLLIFVDIHSLDDLILEDLMKLWWRYLKPLPWNHAYIDEDMEIWCYSCWSSLVCTPSIWVNHGENKLEDCNSFCTPFSIN